MIGTNHHLYHAWFILIPPDYIVLLDMAPAHIRKLVGAGRGTDSHWIINTSIVSLALLVFVLSLSASIRSYMEFRSAKDIHLGNRLADMAIHIANITAMERGIGSAMLGSKPPFATHLQSALLEVRTQSESAWQAFHGNALAHNNNTPRFHYAFSQTESAHEALALARTQLDSAFAGRHNGGINIPTWIDAVARFNKALERTHHVLYSPHYATRDGSALNASLRHWVWMVSEHAGLERGVLAYYLSRREPLPLEVVRELHAYRALVEHHLGYIRELGAAPNTNKRLRDAINAMHWRFINNFDPIRRQIYAQARTGNYPISGPEWVIVATQGIKGVLELGATVTQVSNEIIERDIRTSFWKLVLHAFVMAIASALLILSLTMVRRAANLLFREKALAEVTLNTIGDAVITTDANGVIEYINPIAERMTGWSKLEAAGRTIDEIAPLVNVLTHEPKENPVAQCLREKCVIGLSEQTLLIRRDGTETGIADSATPIHDHDGNIAGAVMVFYSVTGENEHNHLLAHYATHDSLTGLANRREFDRCLQNLLANAQEHDEEHALCYIDLDQFKVINDTCGHVVGDRMLRQVTYLLKRHIRTSDTLARLGGDEFALLLQHCPLPRAHKIAESMRAIVKNFHYSWEGRRFEIGCSIGLVPITANSISPGEILSEADAACYAAKEKGRNRVQIYEPGDSELARRHGEMRWVTRLNDALHDDRLMLYVQDIRPLTNALPMHREILLRLLDEHGEIVTPMSFIPAAERYNLMPDIDRWVIRNTFEWIASSNNEAGRDVVYNINLSGASVSDTQQLLDYITQQLDIYSVPCDQICFEITETAMVQNLVQVAELINMLKIRGVRFALDDFGSGLSSFMYLKTLPVDMLKIDGEFVRNMINDPVDYAMVSMINAIGRIMEISTVAEFIEDDITLGELGRIGIDYVQGYVINEPQPLYCRPPLGKAETGTHVLVR